MMSIVILSACLALAYVAFNYARVKSLGEGTEKMQEIAAAIRVGANAFINYEYRIICVVAAIIAVIMCVLISWQSAAAFLIGAVMSACAGYIGMKVATYANVRVSNRARETGQLGETLRVAFQGGSVMGLSVAGFALLGIFIVSVIFGKLLGQLSIDAINSSSANWLGIEGNFTMTLSGYALGCSTIAMFNRIGGGIYTKAADMGADLVGKTEAHIPEDDPRNPATIADNVGDNVGDVAGLGSDLLESFVGAILATSILGVHLFLTAQYHSLAVSETQLVRVITYPIVFAAFGLIACILGVMSLLLKKKISENPHNELNLATWISAGLTIVFGFVLSRVMFGGDDALCAAFGFKTGWSGPFIAAAAGIVSGIVIGMLAEYYTSYDYNPTRRIAEASREGAALTITQGLAIGMRSCMLPLIVLSLALLISYAVCGLYGVAMAGVGMLSFVGITVSVDTYGPISDNAGGIAEMSELDESVRKITDHLDSVGNTTAAIGKGFAIGSASFAALSMMVSYLYSYNEIGTDLILNLMNPLTLAGALCGAALPFLFSGILIDAVAIAARKMVEEVRRQFREIPGILEGTAKPDYKTCIEISSQGSLQAMRFPALMAIVIPVATGFIFGPDFVGGLLIGGTITAIMLAIFTGNAGGAWDNAKKYIETAALGKDHAKGSDTHAAAVVGDTVGDPLKDTVGPCLDIFIKIMSTVSLVCVPLFIRFNLFTLLPKLAELFR